LTEFRTIILMMFITSAGLFTSESSGQQGLLTETGSGSNEASYMSGKYETSYSSYVPFRNSSAQTNNKEDAVGRDNSRFFKIINPSNSEKETKERTETDADNYSLEQRQEQEEEQEETYHEAAIIRNDAIKSVSDVYLQQRDDQSCPDQKRSNNFPGR
jgi:hypothetical protein